MFKAVSEVTLGDKVPKRGNALTRFIGLFMLRLMGWRVVGEFPNTPKSIVIAAPHTSNWDAIIGLAGAFAIQIKAHFMAKDVVFKPPFKRLLRWFGLVPVHRDANHGLVQQTLVEFQKRDAFVVVMTPEGTRKSAQKWKSGFYHIANQGNYPILVVVLDYGRKEIRLAETLHATGDYQADMTHILQNYIDVTAKNHDLLSAPIEHIQENSKHL